MEFLSNHKQKHSIRINQLLQNAEESLMSVAFVKSSGVGLIIPEIQKALARKANVQIVAGQHFSLTEPKALYKLREVFVKQPSCKLHLAHANSKTEVFHPKLYLFRTGTKGTIVCGSVNITLGGLENNVECSLCIECNTTDSVWTDALAFFNHLLQPENSVEATLLAIKQYESFYESQKKFREKIQAVPERKKSQLQFNYDNLSKYFKQFDKKRDEIFEEKMQNYSEAKKVLNKIASDPSLTQAKFIPLLEELVSKAGEKGWWHSGSLFRKRRQVFPHYKAFQKLVQYVKQNLAQSPSALFDNATAQIKNIKGVGVNYITEILMTYDFNRFANLNKNPITVLKEKGDVFLKAHRNSFTGADYEEYCELVAEISTKLGLRNMLEADSFFNDIYWKIK